MNERLTGADDHIRSSLGQSETESVDHVAALASRLTSVLTALFRYAAVFSDPFFAFFARIKY